MPGNNQTASMDNNQHPTTTPTTSEVVATVVPPPSSFSESTPEYTAPNQPPVMSTPLNTRNGNRKKLILFVGLIAAVVVLLAGSAGAYYGIIVPSKPENILRKALGNTLSQKKTKFDGKFSYESTDKNASLKAVNATFNGSGDAQTNAFTSIFEVTASGIKLPFELRHVNNNIYVKIGDLGGLRGLVKAASPTYVTTFETLNKKLANQWLEIDQTLLKQANVDCAFNADFSLTQEDIQLLDNRFKEVSFAKIKGAQMDTVNGHSAYKYDIEIDDNKLDEYGKGLERLSIVKKIKDCKLPNGTKSSKSLANNDLTPLTIWIDKATKQIVKVAGKSTAQDEKKSQFKANFEITMQYGQASIVKPEGAKPLLEVIGDFSQLLGLGSSAAPAVPSSPAADSVSPACLKELEQYTNSGGTRPIPTCL